MHAYLFSNTVNISKRLYLLSWVARSAHRALDEVVQLYVGERDARLPQSLQLFPRWMALDTQAGVSVGGRSHMQRDEPAEMGEGVACRKGKHLFRRHGGKLV